jgi:ribonuclease D
MKIHYYTYDLPENIDFDGSVAVDTEAMGLKPHRDRLCLVQLCDNLGNCYLVHFPKPIFNQSPNLKKMFSDENILKIFHFARFDVSVIKKHLEVDMKNLYCTKIASFLSRTFSSKHSLKDLCKELLNVELSKQEQDSDWGSETINENQKKYAISDVLHLHNLKLKLDEMLTRENRMELAKACFNFLPSRSNLDLIAGENFDVFAHKFN